MVNLYCFHFHLENIDIAERGESIPLNENHTVEEESRK